METTEPLFWGFNRRTLHYAMMGTAGLLVEGLIHRVKKGRLSLKLFVPFVILSFCSSCLFFRVFDATNVVD